VPDRFEHVIDSSADHASLLAEVQRLRGQVYIKDGAIQPWQLDATGRHQDDVDRRCWHLVLRAAGRVAGCMRVLTHAIDTTFDQMLLSRSAAARCLTWGGKLRDLVDQELGLARLQGKRPVEAGGWALAPELWGSLEAARLGFGMVGLQEALGGCRTFATATVRHRSASILKRVGGKALAGEGGKMPAYYDPAYDCLMEIVRIDSGALSDKYRSMVQELGEQLLQVPVVCGPAWMHAAASGTGAVYSYRKVA
jgi:hypothetical protein